MLLRRYCLLLDQLRISPYYYVDESFALRTEAVLREERQPNRHVGYGREYSMMLMIQIEFIVLFLVNPLQELMFQVDWQLD